MSEPMGPNTQAVPVRVRDRFDPRPGLVRMRESAMPIAQLVIAVTVSTTFAHVVLGHQAPLLAATVTVSSLGLARDARPRTVLETLGGMLVGILIAEAILLSFGQGVWQVALTATLVLFTARFLVPRAAFATVATTQSLIVIVLPTTLSTPLSRLADALVAGIVALLVTVLVPRTLARETAREARALFAAIDGAVSASVQGLERGDRRRADRALEKARGIEPLLTMWRGQLESAAAVARISPWLGRRRAELARHQRVARAVDLAVRNLRVVSRRAVYAVGDDGVALPVIADLLRSIGRALAIVGDSLEDISLEPAAREAALAIARGLDPRTIAGDSMAELNLVSALRPLVVDVLVAAGMPGDDARAALPPL